MDELRKRIDPPYFWIMPLLIKGPILYLSQTSSEKGFEKLFCIVQIDTRTCVADRNTDCWPPIAIP